MSTQISPMLAVSDGNAAIDHSMEVTFRPLTKKQRDELQGYVAWPTTLFRAALFIAVVFFLGWLLRAVFARVATQYPLAGHPACQVDERDGLIRL
jgi:hypothetical protein